MWCSLNCHLFPQTQFGEKELCWEKISTVLKYFFFLFSEVCFFFLQEKKILRKNKEKNNILRKKTKLKLEICVTTFVKWVILLVVKDSVYRFKASRGVCIAKGHYYIKKKKFSVSGSTKTLRSRRKECISFLCW